MSWRLHSTGLRMRLIADEVRLGPQALPAGFGLDPKLVADFLTAELHSRAAGDVALRLVLGSERAKKLQAVVLPRRLNDGVVRGMIQQVKPLANMLALADFRQVAQVQVTNEGAALTTVALTLPDARLAEAMLGAGQEAADWPG